MIRDHQTQVLTTVDIHGVMEFTHEPIEEDMHTAIRLIVEAQRRPERCFELTRRVPVLNLTWKINPNKYR